MISKLHDSLSSCSCARSFCEDEMEISAKKTDASRPVRHRMTSPIGDNPVPVFSGLLRLHTTFHLLLPTTIKRIQQCPLPSSPTPQVSESTTLYTPFPSDGSSRQSSLVLDKKAANRTVRHLCFGPHMPPTRPAPELTTML